MASMDISKQPTATLMLYADTLLAELRAVMQEIGTRSSTEGAEPHEPKSESAKRLGSIGGRARNESLSPERRAAIARAAALKRWGKREV